MNHRKWRSFTAFAAVGLVAAFICGALLEVRQAMASCSIAWDGNQDTCIVADGDRIFSDDLETSVTSYNQIPWLLYMAYTPGSSPHIESGEPLPAVSEEINDDLPGCEGGDGSGCGTVVEREISGTLDTTSENGTFVFSAWDGTYWQCSDTFEVTVKRSGQSCN